jgi:hypothetical protein
VLAAAMDSGPNPLSTPRARLTDVPERPIAGSWPAPDRSGLPAWDERIRALLPASVDRTQILEDLRLTPTERLEKLQALVQAADELARSRPRSRR